MVAETVRDLTRGWLHGARRLAVPLWESLTVNPIHLTQARQ